MRVQQEAHFGWQRHSGPPRSDSPKRQRGFKHGMSCRVSCSSRRGNVTRRAFPEGAFRGVWESYGASTECDAILSLVSWRACAVGELLGCYYCRLRYHYSWFGLSIGQGRALEGTDESYGYYVCTRRRRMAGQGVRPIRERWSKDIGSWRTSPD